jgi:hypothetical protein
MITSSKKDDNVDKDGICNILMYTLFPSSSIGLSHELKKLDNDLDQLNNSLSDERILFANNAKIYKKLKDPKIPMADPSMIRKDAIKDVLSKLISSKERIKVLEIKVNMWRQARQQLESNQLTTDMDNTVEHLNYRMRKVRAIDPDKMIRNMDEITESNKELEGIHNKVNDAYVAGWTANIDVTEAELEEELAQMDEEDFNIERTTGPHVEDELDLTHEEGLFHYNSEDDELGEVIHEETPVAHVSTKKMTTPLF